MLELRVKIGTMIQTSEGMKILRTWMVVVGLFAAWHGDLFSMLVAFVIAAIAQGLHWWLVPRVGAALEEAINAVIAEAVEKRYEQEEG